MNSSAASSFPRGAAKFGLQAKNRRQSPSPAQGLVYCPNPRTARQWKPPETLREQKLSAVRACVCLHPRVPISWQLVEADFLTLKFSGLTQCLMLLTLTSLC